MEMMAHGDALRTGYALNGFGWVTGLLGGSVGHDEELAWWLRRCANAGPDTQVITEAPSGLSGVNTRRITMRELPLWMPRARARRL